MKTPLFWLSLLAVLISCGGTPSQKPPPVDPDPMVDLEPAEPTAPSVLGTVNLSLADTLATQGTLIEPTGITFTRTARALVTDTKRNTRYLNATFKVSNNTGAALNNLRVYAVNTANSLGGTALFGIQNHGKSGLLRGEFARVTQPGQTMNEVAGGAATIDAARANMILLTTGDAAGYAVAGTTTLQYGFRTTETSIANGSDGTMNLSYRLPVTSSNTDNIGFSGTFIVVKDGPNQVAQSPDESIASVKARAVGATELIYIGPSAYSTLATEPVGVTTIKLENLKIGINPAAYLLPNYQYASFNAVQPGQPQPDQGGSVSASTAGPANACAGACALSINARSGQPNTVKLVTTAPSSTATISTTAPAPQDLTVYKNLKVFVEVSNASKTEIVVRESTGELRYPIDASNAKTQTIDLSAPACLSAGTCSSAQVRSGLDKVTRIDLQIESNTATGASLEYGDLLLTDYQP